MKYTALVGKDCPAQAIDALSGRDDISDVFVLPPDDLIDSSISTHPDTILFIYKSKLYCHKSYAEKNAALLAKICEQCDLTVAPDDSKRSGTYPFDCSYNALHVVGTAEHVIGNKKALCEPLRTVCDINTNQGYAACCALAIDKAVVTADPSIAKAAESAGIEVFTVTGGDIALRGYDTGFIGGCTGVMNKTVFTVGNPDTCASGRELASFCAARGIELVSLSDGALTDVGGIKLIKSYR